MGERIRVAAYCRVSTEGEGQAGSFAAQKRYFAERIGWETGWQLGEIYADAAVIIGLKTIRLKKFQKHGVF